MATLNVEIDIEDVMREMSSWERRSLCIALIEDGYGPEDVLPTEGYHPREELYREAVVKLLGMYSRLSVDEIEWIRRLADRL